MIRSRIIHPGRSIHRAGTAILLLMLLAPGAQGEIARPPRTVSIEDTASDLGSCAGPDRVLDEIARHQARAFPAPLLPTSESFDRGEIAVVEDDGTILVPDGAFVRIDPLAAARRFYERHSDDYDYLVVWSASNVTNLTLDVAFAYELNVRNDVSGIGLSHFDYSGSFGSAGALSSFLNMNSLARYPADPDQTFLGTNSPMDVLGHEARH